MHASTRVLSLGGEAGTMYTVQALTEHTTTITGVDNVRALDGYLIQCVYEDLGSLTMPSNIPLFLLVSLMVAVCVLHTCVTHSTLIVEIIIQKQIVIIRNYIC